MWSNCCAGAPYLFPAALIGEVIMNLLLLSTLELRQICYFLAVVAEGNSFSRAADQLHIGQPPLTQRIQALEKKLGVTLFDRRCRPAQLTQAGQAFRQDAEAALLLLERAMNQAKRAQLGEIGSLSIGIASSIANTKLPLILKTFRDRFPEIELNLRELTAEQQIQELSDRLLDVGFECISPQLVSDRPIKIEPIVQESLVLVLPEHHPLTNAKTIPLKSLDSEPLILPSSTAFPFYQDFIRQCEQAGFQPRILQNTTATWMITILSLVAAKLGLAILPSNATKLNREGVVYREIQDLKVTREISVMWGRDHSSVVVERFLEVVREVSPIETLH
jgi:DNA-binding transcriptional LysR family regulator